VLIEHASGRAMLTDFGVALASDANRLTGIGQLVGTPDYMSPELANGNPVDGRSDLYSLGATAFYALTGRPVFQAPSPIAVVTKHLHEPPPPLASVRPDLPTELSGAVDRCLAKAPEDRFGSGEELAEALAATGLTEREVPATIRRYFRQGRGLALVWLTLVALVVWFGRWVEVPPDRISRAMAVLMLMVATLWPLSFLMRTARRVLQSGLGFADVRAAAKIEARVLAEEARAVYGREFPRDLRRTREDWLRLLTGPFGRLVFRVAGVGVSAPSPALRPDTKAPERVVEAGAVEALNALPQALRNQFSNLPEVGDDLCCRVEELRGEPGQQEELARAIGALELVRLDLLRLKAGEGSPEAVKAAINAASALGQETASRRVP
jgi:serine/threonine-protein kinase